jgi:protein tyrosine phosphatase (PTP) superfamily phosphohydrolase (DUF442 family)
METKRITDIPGLMYLWQVDNLFLAGQPAIESWSSIKELGAKKVINLRAEAEMDFSEQEKVIAELGMDYEQFPIVKGGALDAENCKKLSENINTQDKWFIHCGSANRVGGWLITYLVQYRQMDLDAAIEVASNNGLTNPGFIEQAQDIIEG